ncbi:MAG: glycosyltransferase family 2 protein [Candidatus Aenigmarchaeota archaeon]|nr:glycosyltransferase family 2 protein [Candidatus Aenigmarchaeota archaeon]
MTLVTICIVAYNSPTLDSCLESITKTAKNIPHEIFVVDNNSKIHKPNLQDKYPGVKFIFNEKNVGFGRANNQAIHLAGGNFILITNPDLILEKNTIPELVNYLLRNKHVKIAAPKLLNGDGSVQLSCRKFPTPFISIGRRLPWIRKKIIDEETAGFNHELTGKVDWASGACLMLRGKQYFDQRYFLYFEDVDLCRTAKEVHYVPTAQATHLAVYASNKLSPALIHHTASMIKYYLKWWVQ